MTVYTCGTEALRQSRPPSFSVETVFRSTCLRLGGLGLGTLNSDDDTRQPHGVRMNPRHVLAL